MNHLDLLTSLPLVQEPLILHMFTIQSCSADYCRDVPIWTISWIGIKLGIVKYSSSIEFCGVCVRACFEWVLTDLDHMQATNYLKVDSYRALSQNLILSENTDKLNCCFYGQKRPCCRFSHVSTKRKRICYQRISIVGILSFIKKEIILN